MVQQVVNQTLQHPAEYAQLPQQPQQQPYVPQAGQAPVRVSPQSSYPPSSATTSTVRRIFSIGMPTLSTSSASSPVRMISAGGETSKDVVILDNGSDVSLLPLCYGECGTDAVNPEAVQLRDCQGEHLQVTGYRTVSLVVVDDEGVEAELEHSFLIANMKSCILSLGQLYQNGWSVQQHGHGPVLESLDRELRVPVVYQRNSLAIKATACRVELAGQDDAHSPHACVRAVVELEDRFRPSTPRNNHWLVSEGNPYMRSVGNSFIDPRPTWAGNFGYRTTLVQKRSLAEEDHGWHVVEVSYVLDEPYEPESPIKGDDIQFEIEGVVVEPILDAGRDEVLGREIPEFQEIAPALQQDANADVVMVKDVNVTVNSSAESLRALEVARGEFEAMQPHPRYQDAPAQPTIQERKLHEVTHLPFKKWCAVCVQSKSRSGHQKAAKAEDLSERTFPVVQCDFYTVAGNLNCLIIVDGWTKYIQAEPLRNKLASVVGGSVARFLGELGYFEKVELACDNEPALASAMRVAQTIRAAQGLETILQPGQMYGKGKTSLAERSTQTVRAKGIWNPKCVQSVWCAFGEEVFALDPLQAKYASQWRRGMWLTKDSADMDIVAVSPNEIIRSRAIRKVSEHWNAELAIALEVGPWDMRRGVNTEVRPAKVPEAPLPLLYEQPRSSEEGGAVVEVPAGSQADAPIDDESQVTRDKRAPGDLNLPIPVRQRVEEVEATKRGQEEGADSQAKFVRFDPNTAVAEPSPKQPRTALYSPTYAGNLQGSPSSSATRHVRRVVEELELYDEDEVEQQLDEELWDWEFCEKADALESGMAEISDEDQRKRCFYNEGAGPAEVSPEELAWLNFEAMQMELNRLRDLDVIGTVGSDVNTDACVKLDTRLVRDWRLRESRWKRRARLVAREFRGNDCSSAEIFSPTTPLAIVEMLIVLGILHGLAIASLDVGDAFLQVPQLATVLIEIPKWALQAGVHGGGSHFWILKRCLPGQRAAASEWNKFFIEVCERYGFQNFQGTIFKHKEELAYISVHIDDLLVIGTKSFIHDFHEKLSKELKLKIEGMWRRRKHLLPQARTSICCRRNLLGSKCKVPHHGCLQIFDAEATSADEFLGSEEAEVFRSALEICIYVSQERCDIQHSVRVLSTYMARPTKTAMSAVKKLASYLVFTKDMKLFYSKVELRQTTMQRWYGAQKKLDSKPYMVELFSDSDWASCKVSRRSTSSGLIFLNSCLIHSHSRSQTSVSLSSMEAAILAATSLLTKGIYVKQVLQRSLQDLDLGKQNIGPHVFFGHSKRCEKNWFAVDRISTKENPADLNTKPLSWERREFLMRRIGLVSDTFGDEEDVPDHGKKKQLVKLIVNMIMASTLHGCDAVPTSWTSSTSSSDAGDDGCQCMRRPLKIAILVIFCMAGIMARMLYKLTLKMEEIQSLRTTLGQIREVMRFAPHGGREEPEVREWPFHSIFDGNPFEDAEEEENESPDVEVPEGDVLNSTRIRDEPVGADGNIEGVRSRHRITHNEAAHGAANPGGDEPDLSEGDDAGHHGPDVEEDDESFELEETPEQRLQRYIQSGMEEVSDPDEWCKLHYGPGYLTSRSMEDDDVPRPQTMPKPLARQVARRQAMDKAMDMITERDFSGSMNETAAGSTEGIVNNQNYYLMSVPVASFFGIQPVPRAPDAFDDYHWDQIMQGLGPESIVVHNCRDLSNYIPTIEGPMDQRRLQHLLRHLQGLLVKFQSQCAELWIEAAEQVRSWLQGGRDSRFFDEEGTDVVSPRHGEEGEEESTIEEDPSEPGDDGDGGDGREHDHDGGGARDGQDDQVAGRPSSSAKSSSAFVAGCV
eukprot:s76_g4.t1